MKSNKLIFYLALSYILLFLGVPLVVLVVKAANFENLVSLISDPDFKTALTNSLLSSTIASILACLIASIIIFIVRFTNTNKYLKKILQTSIVLPMLLPTITFGFSIIYLFGNNGIITTLFTFPLIDVYSIAGVITALLIYILGPVYLIIDNGYNYLDGKLYEVSRIYIDSRKDLFFNVLLPNLKNSYISAFFIAFVLSFTDYGIPMSLNYLTASKYLYVSTLGSLPNFEKGSLVAIVLLMIPLLTYFIIQKLNKKNYNNENISTLKILLTTKSKVLLNILITPYLLLIISNFIIIIIVPFIKSWPYDFSLSTKVFSHVFNTYNLDTIILFTLKFTLFSIVVGLIASFTNAYLVTRSNIKNRKLLDYLSILCNLVPGMSLGLAYLLVTKNLPSESIFILMIFCNVIHYFTSPYLLFKNALERLDPNLEKIVFIFGYGWYEKIFKVIIPNIKLTLVEVIYYIFVSSMTTLSAIIFLANYNTYTLSMAIKDLQARNDFRGIFVISLVILAINLIMVLIKKLVTIYINKKDNAHANS